MAGIESEGEKHSSVNLFIALGQRTYPHFLDQLKHVGIEAPKNQRLNTNQKQVVLIDPNRFVAMRI
jgi:hypothetical protein